MGDAGAEEQRTLALFDDKEAVGIEIIKATGYSTTEVAEGVLQRLESLQGELPEGVEVRIVQNAGVRVEDSVTNVQSALFEAAGGSLARAADLLVGPEGGWTGEEVDRAAAAGWTHAGLGSRTLRADTAAVVGVSLLLLLQEEAARPPRT